jgi:RNA polymerase sigma-70 factor (ECF subfamily)
MLSTVMGVMSEVDEREEFTSFFEDVEPRLRRALTAVRGHGDGREAAAEALTWAWEHWNQVRAMDNPAGYLYRVGVSRTRPRSTPVIPRSVPHLDSGFEPGLASALAGLSERQRTVIVLVHGCGWTYQEVADALGVTKGSVGTYVRRALAHLRADLGVEIDG